MTIKCKNCGTENGGKSRFCEACGKRLRSGSGSGFGIFVLIMLILGGYYFYTQGGLQNFMAPSQKTAPSAETAQTEPAPAAVAPASGDELPVVPAPVPTIAPPMAPENP